MPRRLIAVACAILIVLPPAVAVAGTQFNYAQGRNGVGGIFPTGGYGPRDYNQVWHQAGKFWEVFYVQPSRYVYGWKRNSNNPTVQPASNSYAEADCENDDDNSNVLWTCQTTQ